MTIEDEQPRPITILPTARAVSLTMNQEGTRHLAAEKLGIETSDYRFVNSEEKLRTAVHVRAVLGYPVVQETRLSEAAASVPMKAKGPERTSSRSGVG